MGHVALIVNKGPRQRLVFPLLIFVVALSWVFGGVTVDVTSTDEVIQLCAIPLLIVGMAVHLWRREATRLESAGVGVALLIVCVPLAQLIPIPAWLWSMPAPRGALAGELAQAQVPLGTVYWSLIPSETERSLWSLLPAIACFLAAMRLTERQVRLTLKVLLGLVLANIAFGFFQVGVPTSSALRLYPDNGSGFSGILINRNHQATALLVGMLIALGLAAEARNRATEGTGSSLKSWMYLALSLGCLFAILFTGSSAGLILGMLFFASGFVLMSSWSRRSRVSGWAQRAGRMWPIALALIGGFWAMRWMDMAKTDPLRYAFANETWRLGVDHFPLGSGIGTFVPIFGQSTSGLLQFAQYVNHAHNEYAQWWMTGGVFAMVVLAAALVLMGAIGWLLLRNRRQSALGISCWLAVCAVLAHSWVDYPMRTLSLMTMTAVLAGLAIAMASKAAPTRRRRRDAAAVQS